MKRHPFDPVSFVLGLTIAIIGFVFFFGPTDGDLNLDWLAPTLLIGVGLAFVAGATRRLTR